MQRVTVYGLIASLLLSLSAPSPAITLDRIPSKFDVSIELTRSTETWQKDFPVVARKLQRWLEKLDGSSGTVESTVGSFGDVAGFQVAYLDHELTKLELGSYQDLAKLKGPHISELETKILNLPSGRGELLFRLQRLKALSGFVTGRLEEANRIRRAAWSLVPPSTSAPEMAEPEDLEWLPVNENRARFFAWWNERAISSGLSCRVRIIDDPEQSPGQWIWNGFPTPHAENNEVVLAHGVHELKVEKSGFEPWLTKVDCRKGGLKEVRVSLSPKALVSDERRTVLWIEPENKEFRLYLHTPGVAFNEISTSGPLRVADLTHRVGADWPVASDAFLEILSEHKLALNLSASPLTNSPIPTEITEVKPSKHWYEDWRFWSVVGVVGVGITAGILASNSSKVETNQGWVTPRRR